jgi:hypothetical protein
LPLIEFSPQFHILATLHLGKKALTYPPDRRLGGPPELVKDNNLSCQESNPNSQAAQPTVHPHTDQVILAPHLDKSSVQLVTVIPPRIYDNQRPSIYMVRLANQLKSAPLLCTNSTFSSPNINKELLHFWTLSSIPYSKGLENISFWKLELLTVLR